eukprot:scaffold333_cov133-Cylindrotheca_fusiformis.AAC.39
MVSLKDVEPLVLSCIDKSDGRAMLGVVGKVCADAFGSNVEKKLGFSKFVKLIEALDSVEVFNSRGGPYCRRHHWASKAKKSQQAKKETSLSPSNTASHATLVETSDKLESLKKIYPFNCNPTDSTVNVVAIDCEDVPENLHLVQVATHDNIYVFDCVKLGSRRVIDFLRDLLLDERIVKIFHDLHRDAAAFAAIGNVEGLRGTLDTQLAMEHSTGEFSMDLNRTLAHLGQPQHQLQNAMKGRMDGRAFFARRPIDVAIFQCVIDGVRLLMKAQPRLFDLLDDKLEIVREASDARALMAAKSGGTRQIAFDVAKQYSISSFELLQVTRPNDMFQTSPLVVSDESDTLLGLLPEDIADELRDHTHGLRDIVLDKGRRPHCWIGEERLLLGNEDRLVDDTDIDIVVDAVGGFGSDNRAGLEKQLHRISAMRNRDAGINGLTLRVGRYVKGNSDMIVDILYNNPSASILFLGEPGSGKTTIVREVTRVLAERLNVVIVDTSNEIAGDGDVPHPCVGYARRMMVPSLDKQSAVMIECVQNHTPGVMVIDEIGRPTEVEAARTCKNRGVRLIASAHGDLRKLVKNPKIRGLVGGLEQVTLGDAQAKEEGKKSGSVNKLKSQRAGPPTFEIIVELRRGEHDEWSIVLDSGSAVDGILEGLKYKAQRRTRNKETGAIYLESNYY